MKRKKIIKAIIWLMLLVAIIAITIILYKHEKEKERLAQEPYFTEYKLNTTEMAVLNGEYHIKVTPGVTKLSKEDNIDTWPDYTFVKIEATEDTEVAVTVMNYLLFDDRYELNKAGWEKAEKYGINTDNRLTVEWVMNHPREAADIMLSMANRGQGFQDLENYVYPIYEKITGIHLEYDFWKDFGNFSE